MNFLKEMTEEYIEEFPEVANKLEIFENCQLNETEQAEQFLIYCYWYFDEKYSITLRFGQDKTEDELETFCGKLWAEIVFQIDFYYRYRAKTNLFKVTSYNEFSKYATNNKNHKLSFFN